METAMTTILLVEDDEICRYATSRRLRGIGYTVLPARDAAEAIDISETWQGPIDLLCTDVRLPDLNGQELAVRIYNLRPHVATLYVTGYSDVADALLKPFTDHQLSAAIETALSKRSVP
jgi:two-component system, cell cycle sensor histidine kinase and response regulator CckA